MMSEKRSTLQERQALLGKGYDPHGGFAALRREAEFWEWVAAGKDPAEFAQQFEGCGDD